MLAAIGLAAALAAAARLETAYLRIPDSAEQLAIHCMKPQHARDAGVLFVAANLHVAADPPEAVRVPQGPGQDIDEAQASVYPYIAKDVRVPVFVAYGSYDWLVNAVQAGEFLDRFSGSPMRWRLQIDDGTHVMHLERNRHSLYESVAAFIAAVEARNSP